MNVTIRSETRRYHVSFEQDNSKVFIKGPHKGRPQTVTTCNIYLLTARIFLKNQAVLVSTGTTTLGSRDTPDSLIGCKEAFTRALSTTYFSKRETTAFWKEFHKRHKRIDTVKPTCAEKFSNTENFSGLGAQGGKFFLTREHGGPVHGYGGLHTHQQRAAKKLLALGINVKHTRHEYSDIPFQLHMGRVARDYSEGGLVDVRKLHGLGWRRPVPEPKRDTAEQLRRAYNYHLPSTLDARRQAENRNHRVGKTIINPTEADYAESERRIAAAIPQPAEDRVTIVNTTSHADAMKAINKNHKKIRDIIAEADRYKQQRTWLRDLWAVADDGLTAKMLGMELATADEFAKVNAELLRRPGITKVLGEYTIDADVFVSAFKVGDIVTSKKFGIGKVRKVEGVFLTVQPGGRVGSYLLSRGCTTFVPDWDCKKHVGRLKRFWTWLRTMAKIHREDSLPKMLVNPDVSYVHSLEYGKLTEDEDGTAKIPGRGLWNMIEDNHCDSCQVHLPDTDESIFLEGPRGGSCKNVKCFLCGQRYRLDPLSRTVKKLDD